MRTLSAAALALLLCAAPAAAQINRGTANVGGAELSLNAGQPHILDGTWSRVEAPVQGTLVMQTGQGQTLTGTYSGKPCHGTFFENAFSLFCEAGQRTPIMITGSAAEVRPTNTTRRRVRGEVAPRQVRIEGYYAYLVTGQTPDGRSREYFRATRN
jgi:hypothetical protein